MRPVQSRLACGVQGYEEAGTDLAQILTLKEAMAKKKAAMSADRPKHVSMKACLLQASEDPGTDLAQILTLISSVFCGCSLE